MTNVSDGCIAHVILKLYMPDVRAPHDGEIYRIIAKAAEAKTHAELAKYFEREILESEKVNIAQDAISEVVQIGLRILFCMEHLPAMMDENSKLELRLLLCRVQTD
jgi:hypothetical protein